MKEITNPVMVFETWLENMRKEFYIKNFKEFREEMYEFLKNIKDEKDIGMVSRIVEKYMEIKQ